jgi:prepilin-type N-terminal cleavage/methylation domain-containing protein
MKRMNHKREQGFTLIELLVVSIIVGILATLVAMTYSGVQAKNRNSSRQANVNALQSQLETFYAEKTKYPSLADLNSASWRQQNLKGTPQVTVVDPQWSDKIKACTVAGKTTFASSPAAKSYSYQATTTDGSPCVDVAVDCTQYTLTATFEGGEKYVKTSLN